MKYRQIRTGQVWRNPDTNDTIRIDEVYASNPYDNDWRAMVDYTIADGNISDTVTATEFGDWIRKHHFALVESPEGVQDWH